MVANVPLPDRPLQPAEQEQRRGGVPVREPTGQLPPQAVAVDAPLVDGQPARVANRGSAQGHAEAAGLGCREHPETPRRREQRPDRRAVRPPGLAGGHAPVERTLGRGQPRPQRGALRPRSRRQDRLDAGAVRTSHHPGVGGRGGQLTWSRGQLVATRGTAARIAAHHRTPGAFANGDHVHQLAPGPLPGPTQRAHLVASGPGAVEHRDHLRGAVAAHRRKQMSRLGHLSGIADDPVETRATTPHRRCRRRARGQHTRLSCGGSRGYGTIYTTSAGNSAQVGSMGTGVVGRSGNTAAALCDHADQKPRRNQAVDDPELFSISVKLAATAASRSTPSRSATHALRDRRTRASLRPGVGEAFGEAHPPGVPYGDHPEEQPAAPPGQTVEVRPERTSQHRVSPVRRPPAAHAVVGHLRRRPQSAPVANPLAHPPQPRDLIGLVPRHQLRMR
jgi:hypothetical protein